MPYNPSHLVVLKVEARIDEAWLTITGRTRSAGGLNIKHAQSDWSIQPETSQCSLTIGNDDGWLTEGNPASGYPGFGRGTRIRVSITGVLAGDAYRFTGEIEELEADYPGGNSSAMEITALGTWGVVARDNDPLRSASYRAITTASPPPVIYWPLALGKERNLSAPQIPAGGPPMVGKIDPLFLNALPDWSAGDLASWLAPGVDLKNEGTARGQIPAMPAGWSITDGWSADATLNVGHTQPPGLSPAPALYLTGAGPHPTVDWDIEVQPSGGVDPVVAADTLHLVFFEVEADGSSTATVLASQAHSTFDGQPHQVRLSVAQSGADIGWTLFADGTQLAAGTVAGKTLQAPTIAELNSFRVDDYAKFAVADVVIWADDSPAEIATATAGYAGETADERIARICGEENISITILGASATIMGPQRIAPRSELLRDAQEADMGIMSDDPADNALIYRTRSHLYTQTPSLTVARGSLTPDTKPVWDNQRIRNDWTVSRIDGGSANYADEAHIARVRRRIRDTIQLNVASDGVLFGQAGWRVHAGTPGGPRYSQLGINLRSVDGARLADQVLALRPGDRFVAAEAALPPQHPPGGLDQLILGWSEVLDADEWLYRPICVPSESYAVVGRWPLLSRELHANISSSATTIDIASTNVTQPMLATSPADIGSGYGITVGTEDMQLTAVADALVTFGATGTASTGSSGSRTPGMPTSTAAGNLAIIFASTRNSGTGVPDTPANWSRWPIFPANANCQVFARIWDGVWSMPTVTYTGGAANEDTIAQSCRLAGNWYSANNVLISSAALLNTSAQNVAYPDMPKPVCDNAIVLYFGWKQDDYTSASSPGTEIQEASTTAGNDASQVWAYAIQPTASPIAAGSFVITGGGSAISRGAIAVVRCDYQIATVQRSINGITASHAAGDAVTATKPMRWGLL